MAEQTFDLSLRVSTTPSLIDVRDPETLRAINFRMKDSIIQPLPIIELDIHDVTGDLMEKAYMPDFMGVSIEVGNTDLPTEVGFIRHNFYLARHTFNADGGRSHMSGRMTLNCVSDYGKQDSVKNRSFQNEISSIVREVFGSYAFRDKSPSQALDIETTRTGQDMWYQTNMSDIAFIQSISTYALSNTNEASQMFLFFDLDNNLHYRSIVGLFSQSPIRKYTLTNDNVSTLSFSSILSYNVYRRGASEQMTHYNKELFRLVGSEYESETSTLQSMLSRVTNSGTESYPVLADDTNARRNVSNFGLSLDASGAYNGWMSQLYVSLPFHIVFEISVRGNFNLQAGRIIEIEIASPDPVRGVTREFSGNWLIIETVHAYETSGYIATKLLLARPTVPFNNAYVFVDSVVRV